MSEYNLNGEFNGVRTVRKGGKIRCLKYTFQSDKLIPYEGQEVFIREDTGRGDGSNIHIYPERWAYKFIDIIWFRYNTDEWGIRRGVMKGSDD